MFARKDIATYSKIFRVMIAEFEAISTADSMQDFCRIKAAVLNKLV